MTRSAIVGLVLAAGAGAAALAAQETEVVDSFLLGSGEVRDGDLYVAAEAVDIGGRVDGDLLMATNRLRLDGEVEGDLFAVGTQMDLRGAIGDSTRIAGTEVRVGSEIDGDLLALGQSLIILEEARIRGGLSVAAGRAEIHGTIEDSARVAAGEIIVSGDIGGDANFIADRLELGPDARIVGDLDYRTRTPLSPEEAARVSGTVRYEEPVHEEEAGAAWGVLFWLWQTVAALLTGLVLLWTSRGLVEGLVGAIAEETRMGALLGFAAFLIVPAAAGIAMVTLVGLPIGGLAALLYAIALYVAKFPIAVWAGGRLLARAGRAGASPYAALTVGVLLLYLLYAVPFVGWMFWLVVTWLGLGAMVVCVRRSFDLRASAA